MSRRRKCKQMMSDLSGFSLMEVMVALLIASILLLGTFSVYSGVLDSAQEIECSSDSMQMVRTAMLRISSDIRSAIQPSNMTAMPVEGQLFLVGADGVSNNAALGNRTEGMDDAVIASFSTLSGLNADLPPDAPFRVEYVLDQPSDRVDKTRLVRRQYAPVTGKRFDVELMDNVASFSMVCRDDDGNDVNSWPRVEFGSEELRSGLPQLVHVEISTVVPNGEAHSFAMIVHPYAQAPEMQDEE